MVHVSLFAAHNTRIMDAVFSVSRIDQNSIVILPVCVCVCVGLGVLVW